MTEQDDRSADRTETGLNALDPLRSDPSLDTEATDSPSVIYGPVMQDFEVARREILHPENRERIPYPQLLNFTEDQLFEFIVVDLLDDEVKRYGQDKNVVERSILFLMSDDVDREVLTDGSPAYSRPSGDPKDSEDDEFRAAISTYFQRMTSGVAPGSQEHLAMQAHIITEAADIFYNYLKAWRRDVNHRGIWQEALAVLSESLGLEPIDVYRIVAVKFTRRSIKGKNTIDEEADIGNLLHNVVSGPLVRIPSDDNFRSAYRVVRQIEREYLTPRLNLIKNAADRRKNKGEVIENTDTDRIHLGGWDLSRRYGRK